MQLSFRRTSAFAIIALSASRTTAFLPRHCKNAARMYHGTSLNAEKTAIVDQVTDQMKQAMRAKDSVRLNTIRLIRSSFANAAIEAKTEKLSDDQAIGILRKMSKMRLESITMFTEGGATERADLEKAELAVLQEWLPSMANEAATRKWVQEAIEEAGDKKNIGKIMGALMKAHKAEVDGTLAQKIVKEEVSRSE